jgi:hypothetical protein
VDLRTGQLIAPILLLHGPQRPGGQSAVFVSDLPRLESA